MCRVASLKEAENCTSLPLCLVLACTRPTELSGTQGWVQSQWEVMSHISQAACFAAGHMHTHVLQACFRLELTITISALLELTCGAQARAASVQLPLNTFVCCRPTSGRSC